MHEWLEKGTREESSYSKGSKSKVGGHFGPGSDQHQKREKKPNVRSKLTMDTSRSRIVQVATPVVGEEGISYNVSTIDLGDTSREQKVDHLQESVATVVHLIQQDKISTDELKAQLSDLIAYIQQWSLVEELPTTSSAPP